MGGCETVIKVNSLQLRVSLSNDDSLTSLKIRSDSINFACLCLIGRYLEQISEFESILTLQGKPKNFERFLSIYPD